MSKLNTVQEDILKLLATRYPYSYNEIESIFLTLGSIDKTISFLDVWLGLPTQKHNLLDLLRGVL